MIPVGKDRKGAFLCSECRHYFPKEIMRYVRTPRMKKVCPECEQKINNCIQKIAKI